MRVVSTRLTDGLIRIREDRPPSSPPLQDPASQSFPAGPNVVAEMLFDGDPVDGQQDTFGSARSVLFERSDARDLLEAVALGQWWVRYRFCPRCGGELSARADGRMLRCAEDHQHFPHIEPAVIMRVTDCEDRILLARQPSWMTGRLSVLAGFVEPGEFLEHAVAREVLEEVGVEVTDVRYVKSQAWPFPSSLMLAFQARATDTALRLQEEEIAEAAWFSRQELEKAMAEGSVALPPPLSVAHQLITDWMGRPLPSQPGSWNPKHR